jgi:2-succinyl-6-hydroxy-2,4-cyclohexadiene-1-carboxylate synthase
MDEFNLHVYDGAPGSNLPTLVFLHGFMGSGQLFETFFKELNDRVRPVAIDLLGHGQSPKPADPTAYDAARQVNQLAQALNALALNDFYLYGYSMGGRLALQYLCSDHPKPSALILESTHAGISDPLQREQRVQLDEQRVEAIESDFQNFLTQWEQADLFQTSHSQTNDIHKRYQSVQRTQDPKALAASLRGFGAGVMPPVWNAIRIWERPTVILCGSEDEKYRKLTRQLSETWSDVNAQHIEIPGAAHRVHADQPDAFTNQLKTFINSL